MTERKRDHIDPDMLNPVVKGKSESLYAAVRGLPVFSAHLREELQIRRQGPALRGQLAGGPQTSLYYDMLEELAASVHGNEGLAREIIAKYRGRGMRLPSREEEQLAKLASR